MMNDDNLLKNSQPTNPIPDTEITPDDTIEQDTVTDRVFDFSDGDIKPVKDIDGPVTPTVNKQVEAALKNPIGSVHSTQIFETQNNTDKVAPVIMSKNSGAWMPLDQHVKSVPIDTPEHPIPHPVIDPLMQAPAVKIYSQIPQKQKLDPKLPTIQQNVGNVTPSQKVDENSVSEKVSQITQPSLSDLLKKVHSRIQAKPPILKEDLLDKNIGTLNTSPFTNQDANTLHTIQSKTDSSLPGRQKLVPKTPTPIPLQNFSPPPYKAQYTADNETKTVGYQQQSNNFNSDIPTKNKSLQDAITSDLEKSSGIEQEKTVSSKFTDSFSALLKPLRTYEGDVAEMMSHSRASTASIAIAEAKKNEGEERIVNTPTPEKTNVLLKMIMVLLILSLVGGGVFGAYYLYSKSPLAQKPSAPLPKQNRQGIVRSDTYAVLPIDDKLPSSILTDIRGEAKKEQKPGTIKEIVLVNKNAGGLTQINAQNILKEMDVRVPDILNRTLTPEWMLGIYTDTENEKSAFVIVTTNFFQNAFAGMLQWENLMPDDLKQYLHSSDIGGISNKEKIIPKTTNATNTLPALSDTLFAHTTSTTTSTSTKSIEEYVQPLRSYFTIRGKFEDRIIKNKDVRTFRTENGDVLFLYSFVDNSKLVIAGDERALAEIIVRLEKQSLIR